MCSFRLFFQKGELKMTIEQVLAKVDEMKPNMMSRSAKIGFINEIESIIHDEIVMTHEHTAAQETQPDYDNDTDGTTELIMGSADGMLYVWWVISKIDLQNMEYDKHNNDYSLFQHAYDEASDRWTRHHMPISRAEELML